MSPVISATGILLKFFQVFGFRKCSSLVLTFALFQITDSPTRLTNVSSILIEIICISSYISILDSCTEDVSNISGYLLLFCKL